MADRTRLTVTKAQEMMRELELEIEQYGSPERRKAREMVRAQELGNMMWRMLRKSEFQIPEEWLLKLRQQKKGWVFEEDVLADDGLDIVPKEDGMVTLESKAEETQ